METPETPITFIAVGQYKEGPDIWESYQLITSRNYTPVSVKSSSIPDRDLYFDGLVDDLMDAMHEDVPPFSLLSTFNALRINPETGAVERIAPLDDAVLKQFREKLRLKLQNSPKFETFPVK